MYVSPFIEMDCTYEISVKLSQPDRFQCFINQFNQQGNQIFYASVDLFLSKLTWKKDYFFCR